MINIFIGYDPKEAVVYHTCVNSIIRFALQPVSIIPLAIKLITDYTETHTDGSNDFTYLRFLVPYLTNFKGHAIFIDGDMIVREDITNLWDLKSNSYAVNVVKHNYKTKSKEKYLGFKNDDYPCKNWSSVMIWNCEHPKNKILTPNFVQQHSGEFLHRFQWLDGNNIGDLPLEWNWLPDEYGANINAKLLHYTLGSPCFPGYKDTPMSNEWLKEKEFMEYFKKC
jgi:lipopolysaccharide biosynthesis glycosyltransferase